MASVLRHDSDVIVVDADWTARVKDEARREPLRRARLNLHRSDDDLVHEMLIAFCADSLNAPHRHIGKTESLHAVEGRFMVVFFDDDGAVESKMTLGPPGSGLPSLYRLSSPQWHTVIPLDDMVVLHETTLGPFRRSTDAAPSWAPTGESALRRFIDDLRG